MSLKAHGNLLHPMILLALSLPFSSTMIPLDEHLPTIEGKNIS